MAKKIIVTGVLTLLMFLVMRWQGALLISAQSPAGIVSFELAKSSKEALAIIAAVGKAPLKLNIVIDFLFLTAYAAFFYFCCRGLANYYCSGSLRELAMFFAKLSIAAGFLDVLENVAMLITLSEHGNDISVIIARWAAIIKFTALALVLIYLLLASLFAFALKKSRAAN